MIEPDTPEGNNDRKFNEHKLPSEIYLKQRDPITLDNFNVFFSEFQRALNPTKVLEYSRFDYNTTNLLYAQLRKSHFERINPGVVRSYLEIETK